MWRRRLFNLAAAVSLLLSLTTIAFWGRARWTWQYDSVVRQVPRAGGGDIYSNPPTVYKVTNTPFGVMAERFTGGGYGSYLSTDAPPEDNDPMDDQRMADAYEHERARGYAGIRWIRWVAPGRHSTSAQRSWHHLLVPHWILAALTGILPAAWAAGWWRCRRRVGAGRCANCGYDLRATPEKCPECGAVPAVPTGGATDDRREEPAA